MIMEEEIKFSILTGKTILNVRALQGLPEGDMVIFQCDDGKSYMLSHVEDCCESVMIESISGSLRDLIDTPILLAEEATSHEDQPNQRAEYVEETQTWTFYRLRTIKGSVDIRWYGTSNGHYSESVDFTEIKPLPAH